MLLWGLDKMKKEIILVYIICLISAVFICGCTQQNDGGTGGNGGATTVTMTAKEFNDDMISVSSETGFSMLYNSLKDGDTLIIQDSISEINYDSNTDETTVTFKWSEPEGEGTLTTSRHFQFDGNITQNYLVGDGVSITVHIKHITISIDNFEYNLEVFEEQWISEDYFSENVPNFFLISQGFKPLPQSCIIKV